MKKMSLRATLLVVPVAAALTVGSLGLAGAANADPADLSITSTSTVGRTLTVTGTGTPGETIQIDKGFPQERQTIPGSGLWTIVYTIPGTATAPINYTIEQQLSGFRQDGSAVVTANFFALNSPANGATVPSRTVTFTGTGQPGSTVSIVGADGVVFGTSPASVAVGRDGTWSRTATFADTAATQQTLTFNQTTGGAGRGVFTSSITLPAAVPPVTPVTPVTPADPAAPVIAPTIPVTLPVVSG